MTQTQHKKWLEHLKKSMRSLNVAVSSRETTLHFHIAKTHCGLL